MSFRAIYRHGFARVAACTTRCALGGPGRQRAKPCCRPRGAATRGRRLWPYSPSWAISGYAIDDLLLQDTVLDAVEAALLHLAAESASLMPLLLVGAPLRHGSRLFNTAVAIHRGRILGVIPKVHLPNYREFYEHRHFASGAGTAGGCIALGGSQAPFGPDLIFAAEDMPGPGGACRDLRRFVGSRSAQLCRGDGRARRCWPTSQPATS